MAMYRQLVSDPLEPEDLWNDLAQNIEYLTQAGVNEVKMFFGVGWGTHVYEEQWSEILVPISQVMEKIRDLEKQNFGALGTDNVYILIESMDVRVEYTYEGDIQLSYGPDNPFTRHIEERWERSQWLLVHHSKRRGKRR